MPREVRMIRSYNIGIKDAQDFRAASKKLDIAESELMRALMKWFLKKHKNGKGGKDNGVNIEE